MSWNAPATATVGQVLTAAFLNTNLRDNLLWLGTRKWLHATSPGLSLAASSIQTVTFNTKVVDTDSFLNLSPGTTPTIPTGLDGIYFVHMYATFSATFTGNQVFRMGGCTGFPQATYDSPLQPGSVSGLWSATFGPFPIGAGANFIAQMFSTVAATCTLVRLHLVWAGR